MSQPSFLKMVAIRPARLPVIGFACSILLAACSTVESTVPPSSYEQQPASGNPPSSAPSSALADAGWSLRDFQAHNLAQTLTLARAWNLAQENDPGHQAALSERAAAQTEARQGRAALLPQASAGYSRSRLTGQRRFRGISADNELDYDSTSAYIQVKQPVYNAVGYAQFEGGKAKARLGSAQFDLQAYETAMRLTSAYLDTLAAHAEVDLFRALVESLETQARIQNALFEFNAASRIDAQETRSRLALARAEEITAKDNQHLARRRLQAITGQESLPQTRVDALDNNLAFIEQPLAYWLERALSHGPALRAAYAKLGVANTEVDQAQGRHMPTVDLVLTISDADNEDLDSLSQRTNTLTVGLQIAIPIYSGGYDSANYSRTRHERRQAERELAQIREQVAAEVIRQYAAVQSGAQRIGALINAVRSGEDSLLAARYGYEYGVNSNLDVLRMQDNLFRTSHELLQARMSWLEARIALAAVAGFHMEQVFLDIDQALLAPPPPPQTTQMKPLRPITVSGIPAASPRTTN